MALKNFAAAAVFLFLLLATRPSFSRGRSDVLDTEQVYEIDYRGPETHTSNPPPNHPHGHRSFINRHITAGNRGRNAKKLHG